MTKIKKYLFEIIMLVVIVSAFIFTQFVIHPFIVQGNSMEPTLHNGDYVFTNVINKKNIKRFDIVCIDLEDKRIVKRLIGLPGEHLIYKDNQLYIDDVKYEEPYLSNTYTQDLEIYLGDDEYYCLGDNRTNSNDSRVYGTFTYKQIYSKDIYKIN